MMSLYSQYVVHIKAYGSSIEKTKYGFFLKNYLITAGHVANGCSHIKFRFREQLFELSCAESLKYLDVSYGDMHQDGLDVAIFEFKDVESPFDLSEKRPQIGDVLEIISVKHIMKQVLPTGSIFPMMQDSYNHINCKAEIVGFLGKYLRCRTEESLEEGRSGCPCLVDNHVCAILHGGDGDISHDCYFLESTFIKEVLNTIAG